MMEDCTTDAEFARLALNNSLPKSRGMLTNSGKLNLSKFRTGSQTGLGSSASAPTCYHPAVVPVLFAKTRSHGRNPCAGIPWSLTSSAALSS